MRNNQKILFKYLFISYLPYTTCILLALFLSSCKIFRSKKTAANTHTHSTKPINISKTNELISLARTYTGVPYKSGGTTEAGMDCSGLLFRVCQSAGLSLPRISYQQAEIGMEIDLEKVQKGDFVFFNTAKSSNRISHVGMVTEANFPQSIQFIHSSTSKGVREDNLFTDYWKKAFVKATRPFVF